MEVFWCSAIHASHNEANNTLLTYTLPTDEQVEGELGRSRPADMNPASESTEWPINGTLDLHLFQPKEAGDLVPVYLEECRKRGILQVRIVHGKGTGQLRERVHAVLRRLPGVGGFGLATEGLGGWKATIVTLKN